MTRPTRRYEGLTFAELQGFRPLLLDLHVPAEASAGSPVPVVVWIHGGAFWSGDRRYLPPTLPPGSLFDALTDAGIAAASIDYRLSGEAIFPAQLDDVRAAIAFLRAGAASWGIDPDRIGIWGESAGGTLAALAALAPSSAAPPAAAAAWYPLVDFAAANPDQPDTPEAWLLGGPASTRPQAAAAATPSNHAHGQAPPFLLMHGTADDLVPDWHSAQLHEALVRAGARSVYEPVEGAGHVFTGHSDPVSLIKRTVEFFAEELQP